MKGRHVKEVPVDSLRLLRDCIVFTLVFGLAAHAYCYFNLTLSHDALFSLYRQDMLGQIQLGRFMHVPYMMLRGSITAPALIGFLSLAFLCFSSYLTVRLLDIRNTLFVALVCGVLATNVTLTLTNASYLHESDMYMLSLLLSCGAVWCCRRWRHGWVLGAVLAALSLGFYQAYFSVALMLFIMIAIGRTLDGLSPRRVLAEIAPMVGTAALGFALYLAAVFVSMSLVGVSFSSGYNGLEGAGDFSETSIPVLIAKTWLYPMRYLVMPEGLYPRFVGGLNVVLSLAVIAALVWLARNERVRAGGVVMIVVLLALMPFAANYVYFIAKGVVHTLMVFAFFYWYVFAVQLQQRAARLMGWEHGLPFWRGDGSTRTRSASSAFGLPAVTVLLVSLGCALVVLFGIVFANQAYFKKQLQFESTELTVNRVLDRVEQVEGYVPGKTPVYLAGSLHDNPLFTERLGFEDVQGTGFYWQTAITYDEASYFNMVLGYPVNLMTDEQAAASLNGDAVKNLGVFPAKDSTAMIDGAVVVRLSEDLSPEKGE